MRGIVTIPNKVLRETSAPISNIDGLIREIAQDMSYYINLENCAGIAAVQLGEKVRMIAVKWGERDVFVLNPIITKTTGQQKAPESCLSIGSGKQFYLVTRPTIVKVKGIDLNGESITLKGHDFDAQVLEHEVDHLDGRMIDEHGIIIERKG